MQSQVGNFSRELETIRKNQIEMTQTKSPGNRYILLTGSSTNSTQPRQESVSLEMDQ